MVTLPPSLQYTPEEAKAEIEKRVVAYQADLATRLTESARSVGKSAKAPLKLLCDGDSWFDYLPQKIPLADHFDVIHQLADAGSPKPFCLNIAVAGDATGQMLGWQRQQTMIEQLTNPSNGEFDAILFSGGGNDLAGDQFCIWLDDARTIGNDPTRGLNLSRFDELLAVIRSAYEDLEILRNSYAPNAWIFIHGYDYPALMGKGVCGMGPWLQPSLQFRAWSKDSDQRAIVHTALERFNEMLKALDSEKRKTQYIPTPGTLTDSDWDNELHPNKQGFAKIAQVFLAALRKRFPDRI